MALPPQPESNNGGIIATEETDGTPIRYLPLDHLYSATSPCSGSSNVMSKKVKARKLTNNNTEDSEIQFSNGEIDDSPIEIEKTMSKMTLFSVEDFPKPPLLFVYTRRRRKRSSIEVDCERTVLKRRRIGSNELERLGIDLNLIGKIDDGPGLRKCRNQIGNFSENCDSVAKNSKLVPESYTLKRWVG